MGRPRKISNLQINKDGRIQFLHPIGKSVLTLRVGSLESKEQDKILDSFRTLLRLLPKRREEITPVMELHPKAANEWLRHIINSNPLLPPEGDDDPEYQRRLRVRRELSRINSRKENPAEALKEALEKNDRLESDIASLRQLILAKDATISELQDSLGKGSDQENRTSLKQLHQWFKEHFNAKSERQTNEVVKRCERVCEIIGMDKKLVEITQDMVLKACNKHDGADNEKQTRRQHIKRMFDFCFRSTRAGGLGYRQNPCEDMLVGDKVAGANEVLDPKDVLPKIDGVYLRSVIAMFSYAGLRPSDLARLKWNDIDEKNGIITIREDATKTEQARFVKPFPNVWKHLKAYKEIAFTSEPDEIAFTRPNSADTWLIGGEDKNEDGSGQNCLSDWIKKQPVTKDITEPSRKLRRWYQTRMEELGFGELAAWMSGHSPDVANKNYTNWLRVAKAAKIAEEPEN